MRTIALLGASALVLALGVGSASAVPTTAQIMNQGSPGEYTGSVPTSPYYYGPNAPNSRFYEGRSAYIDGGRDSYDRPPYDYQTQF
jgi:hypothetical protein